MKTTAATLTTTKTTTLTLTMYSAPAADNNNDDTGGDDLGFLGLPRPEDGGGILVVTYLRAGSCSSNYSRGRE